ncbi:MAG: hypothetical protein FWE61_06245 [Micrococcales bacterium]|nr:hypothetical protein [Micrococcales bacterium]
MTTADRCYDLASMYLTQGNPTRALDMLADAAQEAPDHPRGWQLAALAHLDRGDLPAARDAATRLVALAPESAAAHRTAAQVLSDTGEATLALVEARHSIRLDPSGAAGYRVLALTEPQGVEARDAAATAVRLAPENPSSHTTCAVVALCEKRLDDAERHIGQALVLDPTHQWSLQVHSEVTRARATGATSVAAWLNAQATVVQQSLDDAQLVERHRRDLAVTAVFPLLLTITAGLFFVPALWFGEWVNPGRFVAGAVVLYCLAAFWRSWGQASPHVRENLRATVSGRVRAVLTTTVAAVGLLALAVVSPARWGWMLLVGCGGIVVVGLWLFLLWHVRTKSLRQNLRDAAMGAVFGCLWYAWASALVKSALVDGFTAPRVFLVIIGLLVLRVVVKDLRPFGRPAKPR